jgi:hypothetical protein
MRVKSSNFINIYKKSPSKFQTGDFRMGDIAE